MNGLWLVPLMAVAGDAVRFAPPSPAAVIEFYRQDVRRVMAASQRAKNPDPEQVVPALLSLYSRLDRSPKFPAEERRRLLRLVGSRLHELDTLLTKRSGQKPLSSNPASKTTRPRTVLAQRLSNSPQGNSGSLAGSPQGGLSNAARAQALIDLIRETIDPETWDIHGGEGTIFYFDPVLGLVVRQTAEVHEHVAETLGRLR
jgi:hypothetical protein